LNAEGEIADHLLVPVAQPWFSKREVRSGDCLSTLLYVPLQLKESKRAVNSLRDFVDDDDDDDLERVSWSGEPVGSK
jgi:hypothetical protein